MVLARLTGWIGVVSGFLIVPLLLAATTIPIFAAMACSLAPILLQSATGFISHYWLMSDQVETD
ncbi:hypothetical protein EMM73_17500 [Rheinheimera sediminis]|uniref:hypothetical protein n=1 Tax=Rheinheimera sp. YQF-1 TaxID=2499626 RepID=UPI000FD6BDC8|nr:hypothetical protein [Rheinheimera sp. YQF-1]RVT44065.1 hypothetical protein EMM73_17500 [Rheinheimera sp. YQF-1]